jgi:GntR family transcriptional regulator
LILPCSTTRLTGGRRRADEARRVADLLRRDVSESQTHWKLPSEDELTKSFRVSRNTIRESLDLLRREGLLERKQGAGTFSSAGSARHQLDLTRDFNDTLFGDAGLHRHVLLAERRAASPPVARGLAIEPGDEIFLLEKLATLDGRPMYHATEWLPGFVADALLATDLERDISVVLRDAGYELGEAEFSIEAVGAGEADAQTLDVSVGAPLVLLDTRIHLLDGRPIDWSFTRLRADRLTIVPRLLSLERLAPD